MPDSPDYTSRYNIEDKEELARRIDNDRTLLTNFGVDLGGLEPGVLIFLEKQTISLGTPQWNWLRPILQELVEYRRLTDELNSLSNTSASTDGDITK